MHVQVVAVGKIKERYLQDAIAEYEKRLRPYLKLQITEIPEAKRHGTPSPSQENLLKEDEARRILESAPEKSHLVALDAGGEPWTSDELAYNLNGWELAGRNAITFIIGGDLGLSETVLRRCSTRLSLSPMTFTHQMARLILLEQLYRAERINHGEPYHK
jgi:23S rRNA (pseudouridine1915-N3)-methyltransferase